MATHAETHESEGAPKKPPWWRRTEFDKIDEERLDGAFEFYSNELQSLRRRNPGDWEITAENFADTARGQQSNGEYPAAWTSLKAANRELLDAYDDEEIVIEATRLASETGRKLAGWRREAVNNFAHLLNSEEVDEGILATAVERLRREVKAARRILDDSEDNTYLKLALLRAGMRQSATWLAVMLGVTLLTVAGVLYVDWDPNSGGFLLGSMPSFVMVVVLGGLGASLSGLLTVAQSHSYGKIPEIRMQWELIRYRPIIGAVSAILVVGILQSGIGGLQLEPQAALVAAALAGFSERLVSSTAARATEAITQ